MKSILITGATGFIGSHLLPQLEQNNFSLKITTRQSSPQTSQHVTPIQINNIDETTDWSKALIGVDCVIHLAARAHILQDTSTDPETAFYQTNTAATANLVKPAIAQGVKHFIFMSSIGAMATTSEQILTETFPCQPDTPYGRSKLKAEQALKELCENSTMTWTILRPPLIYGPNNPGNMERLLKLVKTGLPLPLGGINNHRSLLYVGNLVNAITTCISHPKAKNQTFLISDGEDLSTPSLINQLGKAMGKSPMLIPITPQFLTVIAKPLGKEDTIKRLAGSLTVDNNKIRTTLDWNPPFSVTEGLQHTVDWFIKSKP
ncbi:NAD-dependent epimerase/dehydratase family protein [Euhalothece natronophila Z-M001]|uniref:NAD-dependent epimerase/dehydratase family protein n=1 Tax=Euhalothece natronophila Z-M001 TaxID=522448 RepID=A0A5B8NKA6_9CHRO|nr:NAD-dependent epimerase/dehydratase family protein [Euhalothece natronophila]QDZ39378.1 NAD-dependent epimerase/dehydratase family protein [Euhalothece natronophila Z-M001]